MHPLVSLAKKSIENFIRGGKTISLPDPLTPEMADKAGVFVCIKKHGELRGCIGTFAPAEACVGSEIITNAISSATKDPRFPSVRKEELDELDYSVDVLSCPERIGNVTELDPKKYGVIVSAGYRRGLLLPDLEGVDTVEEQLRIAKMKAGIAFDEKVEIYRFEVKRYT